MRRFNFFLFIFLISQFNLQSQWLNRSGNLPHQKKLAWKITSYDSLFAILSSESGIFKTLDGGLNWIQLDNPANPISICDISLIDKNNFWISAENGSIYTTRNGGLNWIRQFGDISISPFIFYIKMFDINNGIAIGNSPSFLTYSAPILKTTDGGNWFKLNSDSTFIKVYSNGRWRKADFPSKNIGYFCTTDSTNDKLYKTTNGGKDWFLLTLPAYNAINVLKFYDEYVGLIFINKKEGFEYKSYLLKTTDGGINWQQYKFINNSLATEIEFVKGNPSKIWLTDVVNLYFSSDTGKNFNEYELNYQNLKGRDISFSNNKVGWFLCDSNKVFRNLNGDQFTRIKTVPIIAISNFKLFQNYPNPFNPVTKIKYSVVSKEKVTLKVFDVLGNEVATLVDGIKEAGNYEVEFTGDNLPSGVYFARLTTGNFTKTIKMGLVK